jgi:hypothetical protein
MRINTTLDESRLKKQTELTLLLIVCVIVFFSDMPSWITALTVILVLFSYAYQHLFYQSALTLNQIIQFDKQAWRWVVLDPKRHQKIRMQEGRLLSVHQWFFVMTMRFETLNKHQRVIKSYVIWRDQVDEADWRRLIVLARFWSNDWNETRGTQGLGKNAGL